MKASNMTGKTVLITGGNKSIGFETARQLGRSGYRIWLGCRDAARGQAAVSQLLAEGLDVRLLEIDVTRRQRPRRRRDGSRGGRQAGRADQQRRRPRRDARGGA
jgi:NAD(P)-dependent dehydrogenase (short-subunit alcohol dehydrogenase family)